jgi:FKBP-type peptidyl-prolyl cis-trans isomerase FklB
MKTATSLLLLSMGALVLQPACAHRQPGTSASSADPKPAAMAEANSKPAAPAAAPKAEPENSATLTNIQDKAGYAIGMNIGSNLKRANFDVNLDELVRGMKDVLNGKATEMTEPQARETIMSYEQQRRHEQAEANIKAGDAFLAENKTKPDVKILPVTLPDGTTSDLQYKVITEGTGEIPQSNDTVQVTYRGTLVNGKEFDSSARHGGQPSKFMVDRVIRGWTEALEHMPVGSKWQLFIPPALAYGDHASPMIPPGSTLIFDVELLGIDKPKPLTSDIIRVPSAAEMKAGEKIEVIKAEDAEKWAKTNHTETAPTNSTDK